MLEKWNVGIYSQNSFFQFKQGENPKIKNYPHYIKKIKGSGDTLVKLLTIKSRIS